MTVVVSAGVISLHNTSSYFFTGKSSLCVCYVEGMFIDSYDPTIENGK